MTIAGSSADAGVGVAKVELRIRRSDGQCFNGVGWQSAEAWVPATSTNGWDTWSYNVDR